jgi:hypothetical protein
VKVRIRKTPDVDELDGVRLDDMRPGVVREVSPSIGAWLITERCAEPEMRREVHAYEEDFLNNRRREPETVIGLRRRWYER